MSASRILLVISALSVGVLAACSGTDTYPITGEPVSKNDPVQEMYYSPSVIYRGEWR
ncbi:MAG: hypothetical protein ACWA49_06375 [Ruegeria sp.]